MKHKHGGKRTNAGRKKIDNPKINLTLYIDKYTVEVNGGMELCKQKIYSFLKQQKLNTFNLNDNPKTDKYNEIINSHKWLEQVAMKKNIPIDKLNVYIKYFLDKESLKSDFDKISLNELKNHFINWITIQLNKVLTEKKEIPQHERIYTTD
ncbi:MAG: hypothetical protein IT243_06150 [Bacteroidia bacterium]|nr:hypothetical protein [Bacteroidia bacterium]